MPSAGSCSDRPVQSARCLQRDAFNPARDEPLCTGVKINKHRVSWAAACARQHIPPSLRGRAVAWARLSTFVCSALGTPEMRPRYTLPAIRSSRQHSCLCLHPLHLITAQRLNCTVHPDDRRGSVMWSCSWEASSSLWHTGYYVALRQHSLIWWQNKACFVSPECVNETMIKRDRTWTI